MTRAKFSIGIDLGTTNCAMAFEPLDGADRQTQVFAIPQWEKPGVFSEFATLPSFLYLPAEHEAAALGGQAGWVPGRFARKRAAEAPGRVAHSAKSWLCHHSVDRDAAFLPWRSDALEPEQRISPVRASAILLQYLRAAWDSRFAGKGPEFRFDAQEVTIAVPASFDSVAQRLTLDAARQADFAPEKVRLIEEPQAAFYRWLEVHAGPDDFWKAIEVEGPVLRSVHRLRHVLVIDIGGGTSDFSLFEITRQPGATVPHIKRVAVSDHLLLGGDNIDLALAHRIQHGLPAGTDLAPAQWNFLVAQCRDLKERCLSSPGADAETFSVSIPGRGSGVLGATLTARIATADINAILMDGFYPQCPASAEPARGQAALREWALPYAADSAVTRYLAAFLHGRPRVDAVLFNGGSLHPAALRLRLQRQIAAWQEGVEPVVLENSDPDLAVARGAARFGSILHAGATHAAGAQRIEAGAARAIYLEVHAPPAKGGGRAARCLVCILPRGAATGEEFKISLPGLELSLGRRVSFQPLYTSRHDAGHAGAIVEWDERSFYRLPPLQAIAKLPGRLPAGGSDRLPISLSATMNELGLLQVLCVSADPRVKQSWPLEFNLRPHEAEVAAGPPGAPAAVMDMGVDAAVFDSARERIVSFFRGGIGRYEKLTANNLLKHLERILGTQKGGWNGALIRALWPALYECFERRAESADHEEAWLIMAGHLLRPGFGAEDDPARIDELWRIHTEGPAHPGRRIQLQQFIAWRRVAGGLDRGCQEAILFPELPKLSVEKGPPAELVRLAGAFERIDPAVRAELAGQFTSAAAGLASTGQHCAPWLAALGLLLNRAPLYAGSAAVLAPGLVEQAYEALRGLDWAAPELVDIQTLFMRAARVVDDASLDLPKGLREKIASKLEKAGIAPLKLERLRTYIPIEGAERAGLFGESLPPGLVLTMRQ
jgi:molecular chaperone DnaK (HSP70)